MKVREVIRLLEQDGWQLTGQRSSHRQYRHPAKPGKVTVTGKPEHRCPTRYAGEHLQAGRTARTVIATWTVIHERGPTSWGAYVPALSGLRVAGETRAEVEQLICEAIPFHLEGLAEDSLPIPDPASVEAETIAV